MNMECQTYITLWSQQRDNYRLFLLIRIRLRPLALSPSHPLSPGSPYARRLNSFVTLRVCSGPRAFHSVRL